MDVSSDAPRILFYSHDSYGLGHLQRTLALANYFHGRWPDAPQLIVTGSPSAEPFHFPETADYLKLPSVVKVGAGRYEPRSMPISFRDVRGLRCEVLQSAARSFQPDVLIADNVPAGLKGELIPTLRYLKESGPARLVLTLRDIVDERARVVPDWSQEGVYELLDDVYDLILVYGDPDIHDPVREYSFSPQAAAKTHYVGYIRRDRLSISPGEARAQLELTTSRLVVVTAGGGGDGYELLRTALEGVRQRGATLPFDCLVVTGPLMPPEQRDALRRLIPPDAAVHFYEFAPDLASYIAAADVVVSMGGYNSVCEILSFRRPAVIVPRVEPRREQLIRASGLANRGLVRMIHPRELNPDRLLREILSLLDKPPRRFAAPLMDGLATAAERLETTLRPSCYPRKPFPRRRSRSTQEAS
jgi:predicted glycosyltransferase